MKIIKKPYDNSNMERLPYELSIYISEMGNLDLKLVAINREFRDLFKEETRRLKHMSAMSKVIDTLLIEMKRPAFKKSGFGRFDFYLTHHVKNFQQVDSLRRWWIKKYPYKGDAVFLSNIQYVAGNTYEFTERVLIEYIANHD